MCPNVCEMGILNLHLLFFKERSNLGLGLQISPWLDNLGTKTMDLCFHHVTSFAVLSLIK